LRATQALVESGTQDRYRYRYSSVAHSLSNGGQ